MAQSQFQNIGLVARTVLEVSRAILNRPTLGHIHVRENPDGPGINLTFTTKRPLTGNTKTFSVANGADVFDTRRNRIRVVNYSSFFETSTPSKFNRIKHFGDVRVALGGILRSATGLSADTGIDIPDLALRSEAVKVLLSSITPGANIGQPRTAPVTPSLDL